VCHKIPRLRGAAWLGSLARLVGAAKGVRDRLGIGLGVSKATDAVEMDEFARCYTHTMRKRKLARAIIVRRSLRVHSILCCMLYVEEGGVDLTAHRSPVRRNGA
jgi:hypothetical protein